jgi:hypothetical protein
MPATCDRHLAQADYLGLHASCNLGIPICSCKVCMTEPAANDVHVDTGIQ